MTYDVIIIGGGLGGLTAGAKLAKEGKKVLLIEQHTKPGGCATTFARGDYIFDVSLVETDGLDKDDVKTGVFEELGVFDHVEFLKLPELYRFVNGRVDIVIPGDVSGAIETLIRHFPHEERAIRKYFKVILGIRREISRVMPGGIWKKRLQLPLFPLLYPNIVVHQNRTVGQFLDSITKNEDLKLVLQANLFFYHDDPYTMSLLWFAAAQGGFFSGGGHYIRGGSQNLSDHLARIIEEYSGKLLLGRAASRILIEDGKAVGVEFRESQGDDKKVTRAFADSIIANAAIPNVANQLLPGNEGEGLRRKTEGLEPSNSITTLYLGLSKPLRELGNQCYCTVVYDEGIRTLSELGENLQSDFSTRNYSVVDYGLVDSQLAPDGKSVAVITLTDYMANWEGLDQAEYQAKKESMSQILMDRLEQFLPGSRGVIAYYEAETPMTVRRYTLNPDGAIFGYAETPKQAGLNRMAQKSPIRNLYFASAWSRPGGNYTGAILSGYFCAQELLRK